MNRSLLCCLVVACLFASACASSISGSCSADTDCKPGSKCTSTSNGSFCVVPDGQCFPSCGTGFTCVSGKCQTSVCTPECGPNQICDPATIQCKDVTVPSVTLTSPADNAFAGLSLQVTATGRAPGGVNGVTFQLQDKTTHAVLATAAGAANPVGSANFAAVLTLNGASIPEGPADLVAVLSYPGGTLNSAPQTVKVDLTGPALSLTSDGTTGWLGPANPSGTAAITATDTGGAGVDTATVLLGLDGIAHAGYLAAAGTNNAFTFSVPVTDLGFSATTAIKSGTVTFHVDASDLVGNKAATLTGSKQVFQVDFAPPSAAITTDANWHSAAETTVAIAGTASDAQSGLIGGAARAVLTGGTLNQTGTLTASSFSFTADLSTQTFGATEAQFPISVTVTDAVGNSEVATANLNVDNAPPVISGIQITTPADATVNGHGYYAAGAGSLTVTATIADGGAGVAQNANTPCLQVVGAGGCVAGTRTSGDRASGTYKFSLPRSAGAGNTGAAPVQYTISAQDALATSASDANHAITSGQQGVYFDNTPPSFQTALNLPAAGTWVARGGAQSISVGVSDSGSLVGTVTAQPASGASVTLQPSGAGVYSGLVDLSHAPAGQAGSYAVAIAAADAVGNPATESLPVLVDDSLPVLTLTSDGTATWLGPAIGTGAVAITATDTGSSVDPATVLLTLDGVAHAPYLARQGVSNVYTFSVPVADLGISSSTTPATGKVTFHLDGSDKVANKAATLTGAKQVFQVDFVAPTLAITADNNWHAASETAVTVAGTASDLQSGLIGGAAKAVLTGFTSLNQTVAPTSSGFSFAADLTTQTFAATEAQFPITVTVTDNAGNSKAATGNINVDNLPPVISSILVATGADAIARGHNYYAAGAGTITVTATIADGGAGVATSTTTPCLQVGSGACVVGSRTSGTAASGSYTFLLPRSAGNGNPGVTPVQFTITAQDSLASGPTDTHHAATSAAQSIYFDDVAPTITIASDLTWYARKLGNGTGVTLSVSATITDAGSDVSVASGHAPTLKVGASTPVVGSTTDGVTWIFALDLTQATAGTENPLDFTLSATDAVGAVTGALNNSATKAGFRNVDDKAPLVTLTSVVKTGTLSTASPSTPPVYYPALVANTGYDATATAGTGHFFYSDSVDIAGTILDQGAGISVASNSPYLQLNGIAISGAPGSSAGPHVTIGNCTDGQSTSCAFTVTGVSLRDLTKVGAFNAADNVLQLVFTVADKAVAGDGVTAAVHTTVTAERDVKVTRFWWSQAVAGSTGISGLAIHPDHGDVILTSVAAAGSNSVFALYSNGPFGGAAGTRWAKGAQWYGAGGTVPDLGAISGAPTIGAGASSPLIYVATQNQDLVAINSADGTLSGKCITDSSGTSALSAFSVTPTILPNATIKTKTCEAVLAASTDGTLYGACLTPTGCTNTSTPLADVTTSSLLVQGNAFYLSANTQMAKVTLNASTGKFSVPTSFPSTPANNSFTNILFDGTQFYGITPAAGSSTIFEFEASLHSTWSNTAISKSIQGQPIVSGTSLLFNTGDRKLHSVTEAAPGTDSVVATLLNPGTQTILGSDGHLYTSIGSTLAAVDPASGTGLWNYGPSGAGTFTAAPTMSCSGILYAASGATVYALITDAAGLGNTPWPKYQRDSRNSGNADATTQWGVSVGGACTQ